MQILTTWFNTEFPNGWICREQIRGSETEHYANIYFLVQKSIDSNPPSMLLPLTYLFNLSETNV